MYIAAGRGQTTPGDKILMSTETSCHFSHLLQVSKKSLWSLILYNFFFMILYMYIHVAPGQGLTTPRGRNFYVNRNILSLWSFVASFKKNLFEVWFYAIFFMILYMYTAPGQGQTAPRGQSFNVNRNVLSFHSYDASLKKCLWSLILYNLFSDLIHVYSPGAGADSPQGTKFGCQQKGIITLPIRCKFQRNLFEVWFYTFFFMI